MKKLLLIFSIMLSGVIAFSQPKMQLATEEHDFGAFKEEAGRQTFDFLIINTGDAPLVIQNVAPSCGCTTPEWTKEPIPPKGKGKVTAIYDPKDRPGGFNKTLTVTSNSKPETVVLVIRGEVVPKEKTVEDLFTWPVGNVRFESNHLAFTNIKKTEKKIKVMPIINTSKEPVKVEFEGLPAYLSLKTTPETLKPGQKGLVEGTYDATKNQTWGNVFDMVKVKINGVVQQNILYYVSANLVEDFSGLSKEQLANAPVFKVVSTTLDIGTMQPATTKDVEFNFTNEGKSDLIIRNIKSTCGCTVIQQGKTVIKSGDSSTIKATFNSGTYNGKQTKVIYVYTNDPNNSEVAMMFNANVVPTSANK